MTGLSNFRLREFRGYAKIPLSSLNFDHALSGERHRTLSQRNVNRLRHIFSLEGCHRYDENNFVSGIVDSNELAEALHAIGFSPTATLEAPTDAESIPLLKVRNIKCLYGLHRVRAGQQYLDVENQWWIVKLYTGKRR